MRHRSPLELTRQISALDLRIRDLYLEADPNQILMSVPGVGKILAGQIRGRLGDPARFTSLAAVRSFSGLIPREKSSGLSESPGGPTKRGDACLREALFSAADHARKIDPTLAARYHRLMCQTHRHHSSALCTIATVLLTRMVACLRNGTPYVIRDLDGREITAQEGREIVVERFQIPLEIRAARRTVHNVKSARKRDERTKREVAERFKVSPVPASSMP